MMIIREGSKEWLFNNMKYYSVFTDLQKNKIFYITTKNLIYSIKEQLEKRRALSLLKNMLSSPSPVNEVKKYIKSIINKDIEIVMLNSWQDMVQFFITIVQKQTFYSKFVSALIININLHESGLCPLLLYAFHNWQWGLDYPSSLERIVELSLIYLYRLIPKVTRPPCNSFRLLSLSGAASNVYIDKNNRFICKAPKNLAASLYLIPQEYKNVCLLSRTPLGEFIPANFSYNSLQQYLYHKAILGNSGEDFLFNNITLSKKQIRSLEKFYNLYLERIEKNSFRYSSG